jgi:hypothetical protein
MIRFFYAFGKSKFNEISDLSLFHQSIDAFHIHRMSCSTCGSKHSCSDFSSYSRHMISFENNSVICHKLTIPRVICNSCGHTHAILPDILIPFGSYSLTFVLTVLRSYFIGTEIIVALCSRFQISVATLYDWIHLFKSQKKLWLGVLRDHTLSSQNFLNILFSHEFQIQSFFSISGFSFLQQPQTTRFNSS